MHVRPIIAHKSDNFTVIIIIIIILSSTQSSIIFLVTTASRITRLDCWQLQPAAPHSGDWLHALPISACGLHLEDNAIRVAVGLRLGSAICETHTCPCGATADSLGQHALSCRKHPGRVQCHAQINDLHRALKQPVCGQHYPRSHKVSAEMTERGPLVWLWYRGIQDAVPHGTWLLSTHRLLLMWHKVRYRLEIAAARKSAKYSGDADLSVVAC